MPEILILPEVADRLRLSKASVHRLLADRRRGVGTFPLPLSKGKLRWLSTSIDQYVQSLSSAPEIPERKKRAKEFLAKCGINPQPLKKS